MTTVVSVTIQSQWDEAKCPTMEIQTRQELLLDEYDTTKGRECMNGLDAWIWGKFNQGNQLRGKKHGVLPNRCALVNL